MKYRKKPVDIEAVQFDGICVGNHVISSNGDYGIVTRINAETNQATVCTIINQSGGASFTTYDNYKDKLKLVD